jgi:endonuclease/exonuclease/phosphatase family metal-dependent hydrolase
MDEQGGDVPRRVIARVLEAGYIDTLAAHAPGPAATAASFSTLHPGQRVDYIFSFGLDGLAGAWIEQDRLARYASDHFPVGAEFRVR